MTEKLVKLLFACGVQPAPRAKVLAAFIRSDGAEITSRELERNCDLRQPEVSLALSAFLERKWVSETKLAVSEKKGRPSKVFVLAVPKEIIYQSLAAAIEKENKEKTELLAELKTAMMVAKKSVQPEIPPSGKQLSLIGLSQP